MNVYDFDKTIYDGDSTIDFWKFCAVRYPGILRALPNALLCGFQYRCLRGSLEDFKSAFLGFCRWIPNMESVVTCFWDKRWEQVCPWYLAQKQETDVVISASPDFLLRECCSRLGVKLIATPVDQRTGRLLGQNCKGEEKAKRFRQIYPTAAVENFYSDSFSDAPMARIAQQSFLVRDGKLVPWKSNQRGAVE